MVLGLQGSFAAALAADVVHEHITRARKEYTTPGRPPAKTAGIGHRYENVGLVGVGPAGIVHRSRTSV